MGLGNDFARAFLDGIFDVIKYMFGWFGTTGPSGLNQDITVLESGTHIPLTGSWFKSEYTMMWGIALIISLLITAYQILKLAIPNRASPGELALSVITTIPKIYLKCLLLPFVAAILIVVGDLATNIIALGNASTPTTLDVSALLVFTSGNPIIALFSDGLTWLASILMEGEAYIIEYSLIIALLVGTLAIALKESGTWANALYENTAGLLLVSIFGRPVMLAIIITGGDIAKWASSQNEVDWANSGVFWNLLVIGLAIYAPIGFFRSYSKKYSHIVGGRVDATGSIMEREPSVTRRAAGLGLEAIGAVATVKGFATGLSSDQGPGQISRAIADKADQLHAVTMATGQAEIALPAKLIHHAARINANRIQKREADKVEASNASQRAHMEEESRQQVRRAGPASAEEMMRPDPESEATMAEHARENLGRPTASTRLPGDTNQTEPGDKPTPSPVSDPETHIETVSDGPNIVEPPPSPEIPEAHDE